MQLTDANALTLGTVTTTGNLTVNSTGALNLGTTTVGGNLAADSSNGAITQTGALTVSGTSSLDAGTGNITLTNAANDFTGAVSAAGAAVQLTDANALTLGTVTTTRDFLVASNGALDLGLLTVGGALSANSTNGDITQTGVLTVTDTSSLNAGTGRVTLANTSNHFGGAVTTSASVADVQGNAGSAPSSLTSSTTTAGASTQAPAISGTATAGAVLSLYDGNTLLGTTTSDAITGTWTYQVSNNLSVGSHSITAKQTVGGVTSIPTSLTFVASAQVSVATPPVIPVTPPVVPPVIPVIPPVVAPVVTPPPAPALVIQVAPEPAIASVATPSPEVTLMPEASPTSKTATDSTDQKSKVVAKAIPAIEPMLKVAIGASVSADSNLSSNFVALGASKSDAAVVIDLLRAPTAQSVGLITVTLPVGMLSADAEVLISLVDHIKTTDASTKNEVLLTLPNGKQPPPWIKYNDVQKVLVLAAAPDGIFPFQMMMSVDGQRSLLQIQRGR